MVTMKKFIAITSVASKYILKHYVSWIYFILLTVFIFNRLLSMNIGVEGVYRFLLEIMLYFFFSLPIIMGISINSRTMSFLKDMFVSKGVASNTFIRVQHIAYFLVICAYLTIICTISFLFISYKGISCWHLFLPYVTAIYLTALFQIPLFIFLFGLIKNNLFAAIVFCGVNFFSLQVNNVWFSSLLAIKLFSHYIVKDIPVYITSRFLFSCIVLILFNIALLANRKK